MLAEFLDWVSGRPVDRLASPVHQRAQRLERDPVAFLGHFELGRHIEPQQSRLPRLELDERLGVASSAFALAGFSHPQPYDDRRNLDEASVGAKRSSQFSKSGVSMKEFEAYREESRFS
jgi:hypothetical protein